MKEDYTRVLQAHIRLARVKFLYGCSGANLDILARQPLWDAYLNYNHGTGHGVGYLANIHEPPSSWLNPNLPPKANRGFVDIGQVAYPMACSMVVV